MSDIPDILRIQAPARILLICPDCGHENSEVADRLRGKSNFACRGDGCDYSFDFNAARRDAGQGFAQLLRRFYAAFYPLGGQGAG
jgi:hypothetical protein